MSIPKEANMSLSPANTHTAVDTLAWLIHDAFEGDPEMSLLANLRDLQTEDWTALPPGGERTIADIVEHVGWCKWMYEDYAFGPGTLRGDQPPLVPDGGRRSRPPDELVAWLTEGHGRGWPPSELWRAMPSWSVSAPPIGVSSCRRGR